MEFGENRIWDLGKMGFWENGVLGKWDFCESGNWETGFLKKANFLKLGFLENWILGKCHIGVQFIVFLYNRMQGKNM